MNQKYWITLKLLTAKLHNPRIILYMNTFMFYGYVLQLFIRFYKPMGTKTLN